VDGQLIPQEMAAFMGRAIIGHMLIGIEASRANRLQKTGVEWYAYHLIQHLKRLPEAEAHSWMLYGNTPLSMGLEKGPANWHEQRLSWPPTYLWTQWRLSLEMVTRPPEVLFVPAHVLPRVIPKRSVVTIHDVGFIRHPELYPGLNRLPGVRSSFPRRFLDWSTRDVLKRASRIITVSEFSKRELVDAYGADPERIFVTHLGINHERYTPLPAEDSAQVLQRFRVPTPYILYVGRLEQKKNVTTLIEAFTRYKQERGVGDPLQLVLLGQPGAGYEAIAQALQKSTARNEIHLVGYVSEEEKIGFLSAAVALVHPSWYEGFGFTPLEAMACGCPVICSHAGSLPEVVGIENALWFSPSDPEALERCLFHMMDDDSLRRHLRERGSAWVKRYTWEATARQTLPIITDWK
jgi:glycosyltransferase involved in cell wall biosynthesis